MVAWPGKLVTKLVDDLDGGAASETVTFGLDGQLFEIDLLGEERQEAAQRAGDLHRAWQPRRPPAPPAAPVAAPQREALGRTGPFGSGRRRKVTTSRAGAACARTSLTRFTRRPGAERSPPLDGSEHGSPDLRCNTARSGPATKQPRGTSDGRRKQIARHAALVRAATVWHFSSFDRRATSGS